MKKSIVISLLTVATLCSTALCSFASTGVVTTDTLRLREEASTDSSTVALLSADDEVEILGEEEHGWYKVKSGDKEGYVAAQYINVLAGTKTNEEELNKDNKGKEENTNTSETNTENTETNNTASNSEGKTKVLGVGEKIYITPLINSLVIEKLEGEKQVEIISEVNGWSYIKIGTLSGWVRTEKIKEKNSENNGSNPVNNSNNNNSSQKTGYIAGTSINFRETPNTSGEIITSLKLNTKVKIISQDDDWTEIEYNGDRGYVATQYISTKEQETTSRGGTLVPSKVNKNERSVSSVEEKVTASEVTGSDVIAFARQYLGYKYTSGGSTASAGFDCSGFTTYVYKHFGISLNRTSGGQSANGVQVAKENLAAGDIICFANSPSSKSIGHVGIYIGGGKFIHSANSRQGVIISNVTGDGYYFVTARRVL